MHNYSGFTLFELMIAIAVIAILSAIAVPAYQGYIQKAALTDMLQSSLPYKTAVELCVLDTGSLTTCNSGTQGITASKATRYISSINVAQGQIDIQGQSTLANLLVVLKPKLVAETGQLEWQRSCTISNNPELLNACQSVFRFSDLEP